MTAAVSTLFLVSMGCTSTRKVYVPIEQLREHTHTDTVRLVQLRTDTVFERDSVSLIQRGDTVFISRTLRREKIRERRDTIYVNVKDTLRLTHREAVQVPCELSGRERLQLRVGKVALVLIGMLLVYVVLRVVRRLRR